MSRGPRVVVRRGGRVQNVGPPAERRTPRGRGVLVATGATLALIGLVNVALNSLPLEPGVPLQHALPETLERLPLVALGAGLLSFAIVRDPGPFSAWIGAVLLGLVAISLLGASVVLGLALSEAWGEMTVPADARQLEPGRAALQAVLYTSLFLYLAVAVWRSRPRSG